MNLRKLIGGLALSALMAVPVSAQTLRYATIGEPPSLDVQMGTATLASTISQHMFETLYAFDAANAPQPFLATGETISDDGKTIVISLRDGVMFHNGDTMDAEDVAASLSRWGEHGARGKLLDMESVEATGELEVTISLAAPNGAWKSVLAFVNGGPVIYPAEIVSEAAGEPIAAENYVGTGPYQFGELRPNRYVELLKFEDYSAHPDAPDGAAGERVANFDALRFIPVPDVGTRMSGVQAGDYDYAEYISGDLYGLVKDDPSVQVKISAAPIFGLMFMNSEAGPMATNFKLRQAVLAALNMEQALQVSVGEPELFEATGAYFGEGNIWHTEAGTDAYNQGDPEKAKRLAEEAGYDGTPIKLLVSTNYKAHFDDASVFTRQLADAGINVQMVVVDWATLLQLRAQPSEWDMFMTHHGTVPDPVLLTMMNDSYPGWWQTEEKHELLADFTETSVLEERQAVWEDLQALMYEQVPAIKVGNLYSYDIASPDLTTAWESAPAFPYFWGASK
ncbi:ABC transporter substrate-binding protein [Psychromarinibacter sp. C21-152]|uniref:ABC transporter substrate-binding protein n=1 Tax=Psychromarinibacter sediminicola TaxID=3033385 RepID=A0AAE3TA37_9RHOB|nr:ABC transporter substrate-binding protein [Psychromarinibacter sediminicola]MDF0601210.1 ABC transporter substrate-binding protein [Psychromarinibacter sediminicola]